jgi:hypothetical protein
MRPAVRSSFAFLALTGAFLLGAPGVRAQTIQGTLLDRNTDRPIATARIVLVSEAGDSVASALTNAAGRFVVRSPRAGGYYLMASGLGYRETTAGIFDLEPGGEMTVEFRIYPLPITLDEIIVATRPGVIREGALITNGFYQRMSAGLGYFLTPADIAKSQGLAVTELLYGIPRVSVLPEFGGNRVLMSAPLGECGPSIYVDGVLVSQNGEGLDAMAPLNVVEAVEVYRGAAELPLQWSGTAARGCGAIVIWTKG